MASGGLAGGFARIDRKARMSEESEEVISAALQDILRNALVRIRVIAGVELAARVVVEWNTRMRSTAGRAFWPEARVELNPKLIGLGLNEVERTLLHELAHLVAYHRAGRKRIAPHGVEWREACVEMGIPGERATHQLGLPSVRQARKWKYVCPACGYGIERVREMKRRVACHGCCRRHSGGRYDERFRLQRMKIG